MSFNLGLIVLSLLLAQPSKLQLMEEAVDRVLMTHGVAYEKGNKLEGKLADITISYTGNTTIDASQDSTNFYVYGSYTFIKNSYVQAPNIFTGGNTGKTYNSDGSTTYIARVKSVLDDYRVQEIIVVDEPEKFDFQTSNFDSLKTVSDWIYPTQVYQSNTKKKDDK